MVLKHTSFASGLLALAMAAVVLPVNPAVAAVDTGETRVLSVEISDWPRWKEISLEAGDPSSWRPCDAWLNAIGSIDFTAFDLPVVTTSVSDCVAISGFLSGVVDTEQHKRLPVGFKLWVPDSSPVALEAYIDRYRMEAVSAAEFVLISDFTAAIEELQGIDSDIYQTLQDAGLQIGRLDHSLTGLEASLATVSSELDSLLSQVSDNTNRISTLEANGSETSAQLTQLGDSQAVLVGEVDAHGQRLDDLDALPERVDAIGSVVERQGYRWSELSTRVDGQGARLDALEARSSQLATTAEESAAVARQADEAAVAAQSQADSNSEVLLDLDSRVRALESAAEDVQATQPVAVSTLVTDDQPTNQFDPTLAAWMIAIAGGAAFFIWALGMVRAIGRDEGEDGAVAAVNERSLSTETLAENAKTEAANATSIAKLAAAEVTELRQGLASVESRVTAVETGKADKSRVNSLEERVDEIEAVQRHQVEMDVKGRFNAPGLTEAALNNLLVGQKIRLENVGREDGPKFSVDVMRAGGESDPHLKLVGVNEYDSVHPKVTSLGESRFKVAQVYKNLAKAISDDKVVGVT